MLGCEGGEGRGRGVWRKVRGDGGCSSVRVGEGDVWGECGGCGEMCLGGDK